MNNSNCMCSRDFRGSKFYSSRPEDALGIQAGRDSTAGKDFNKDLGAGLDSLNHGMSHITL